MSYQPQVSNNLTLQSGNYNFVTGDYMAIYTGTAGATFTLLSASSGIRNRVYAVKHAGSGSLILTGANSTIFTTDPVNSLNMSRGDHYFFQVAGSGAGAIYYAY